MAAAPAKRDYDHLIKLLLIGDSGVGKSCLLLRFAEDQFTSSFITTIGIDFKIKKVLLDGAWAKLQVWDTAGQERFRTITAAYYRGAGGVLLVYDVSDAASFASVRNWLRGIEQHAADGVVKVLVGNKADVPDGARAVSTAQGAALAKECGMAFFETSAKTGAGVDDAFLDAARSVVAAGGGGTGGAGEGGLRLTGGGAGGGAGAAGRAKSACCGG